MKFRVFIGWSCEGIGTGEFDTGDEHTTEEIEGCLYFYTEGNFSCDHNRDLFLEESDRNKFYDLYTGDIEDDNICTHYIKIDYFKLVLVPIVEVLI